jgi:primosomal protein N' (replication factor Y)
VFTTLEIAAGMELTKAQRTAWELIKNTGAGLTKSEIEAQTGVTPAMVTTLLRKGVVRQSEIIISRKAYELGLDQAPPGTNAVTLTDEQAAAVETILGSDPASSRPFLLYGITGSGKTHVYTALAKRVLASGRGVIILVPEISLTPQTIACFRAAVGDIITVIHSHMSDGERRDSLQEIVTGAKRLVIGVRSAILVSMENVGLIMVDEEHDGSYKQSDIEPRYHARDVAIMRGKFQKALVVPRRALRAGGTRRTENSICSV